MGTRRNKMIVKQNDEGLSAPLRQEVMWKKVHRVDAWIKQGRRCKWCLAPVAKEKVTADHRIARKAGGTTSSANIDAACGACNTAKGHMPEQGFKKAIRRPEHEHRMGIWLAYSRRTIWLRTAQAERRILQQVGMEA